MWQRAGHSLRSGGPRQLTMEPDPLSAGSPHPGSLAREGFMGGPFRCCNAP